MKKTIGIIGLALIAIASFAKGDGHKQTMKMGTRQLETPVALPVMKEKSLQVEYDTATQIGVLTIDDNAGTATLRYFILDSKANQVSNGVFKCTGGCYTIFQTNYTKNEAFDIVADSVLHVAIIDL